MSNNRDNRLTVEQIIEQLWQVNERGEMPFVYAVLDGARDKRIEPLVNNSTLEHECLYSGTLSYALRRAAPYIVRLEPGCELVRTILVQGWGNSWGIFAIAYPPATLSRVRSGFRRIAKAISPEGKNIVFRYYDPRVLRPYLPTCSKEEADHVFSHVSDFVMDGDDDAPIYRFRRVAGQVVNVIDPATLTFPTPPEEDHWGKGGIRGPLKIRPQQYRPFIDARRLLIIKKAEQHIQHCFPQKAAELQKNNEFNSWVKRNVEKILSLGFTTMQEILRVLNAVVQYGETAYEADWFHEIMAKELNSSAKSSAIENSILQRMEALNNRMNNILQTQRQNRLIRFRNDNIYKLQTIGKMRYGLEFENKNAALSWLTAVGEHGLDHDLKFSADLDMWLDLSMQHGERFFDQTWAQQCLEADQLPQQKMVALLKQQPVRNNTMDASSQGGRL